MAYGSFNFQKVSAPVATKGGGATNKFGWAMSNPNYGGPSTKPLVIPKTPAYGGTDPLNVSYGSGLPDYYGGGSSIKDWQANRTNEIRSRNAMAGAYGSSQPQVQEPTRYDYPSMNMPDIPELRSLGDVERYTGQKWTPSQKYESAVVDTTAVIDATDALLKERLGGEMSEAARRFGQAGALMSGGGLGGGYAGTLGESERGYRRDLSEITNRYRVQAAEADAQRKLQAYNAAMGRELQAHEGYEGRRFGDVGMANQFNLSKYGIQTDYDKWKYGAEWGQAQQEQQDAINTLLGLYGV